jgi:hypothetical protein
MYEGNKGVFMEYPLYASSQENNFTFFFVVKNNSRLS